MSDIHLYTPMVKGKSPQVVFQVIKQVLAVPNLYFFAELLAAPEVMALAKAEEQYKLGYDALRLFSSGTYPDYVAQKAKFDALLTPGMLSKLRELTVVHLASKNRVLPYDAVMKAVGITDVRELEDLLIDAITHDLLKGKLDQRARAIEVYDVVGCDVAVEDIPAMIEALVAWDRNCEKTLQAIQNVKSECVIHFEQKVSATKHISDRKDKTIEELKRVVAENLTKLGGPSVIDEVMTMMVMGEEEASRMKGRNKRGGPDARQFMRPF